jgi:hypothetical protein
MVMMSNKLEAFKAHAVSTAFGAEVYLITHKDDTDRWGLIYVDPSFEDTDNHCEECMKEHIMLLGFRETPKFPYRITMGTIGPTKFKRLENGETTLLSQYTLGSKLV